MTYETIKVERDGGAFVLQLHRPDNRNAINLQMMEEVERAVADASQDRGVFGVIVTGGDRYFSAGADLKEALEKMDTTSHRLDYTASWRRLNSVLENCPKPVIAAIEGFCITGGFELALACDLRVAGEKSQFAITSSKIGTVPGGGGTQRLPRIVGVGNALEILFSAEPIDAQHALRIGLLNRLVPTGQALAEAKAIVSIYGQRAPLSLQMLKSSVYAGVEMSLRDAIEFESLVVNTIAQTDDRQEGITAFLEKRKAVFKGE